MRNRAVSAKAMLMHSTRLRKMTVMGATIEDLKRLPVSVRIQLVEDLWDSIAEDPQALGLTPEHIAELDRRLDALEAQPRAGTAWEVARERILASL